MQKINVLGVGVSAVNMTQTLTIIDNWITQRQHNYVCVTGVHGVMESQRDERLRRIHNEAGLVVPDGMPLVWIGKLRSQSHMARVYGPDLMLALCERSLLTGYRHFLYGGAEGIPELLAQRLQDRFPGLQIVGTYSPPFRPLTEEEDKAVVHLINTADPDIIWIGLSTPKQERWMAAHVGRLNASVLIGVGAAFDFHTGIKPQAPAWMQQNGLEWLFRLLTEPRRLWKRYLINNPLFIANILLQLSGVKRYPL
jgi:N-acetylglucosaminyldiphosphoundecaprenol N-acetyl-beta-D-mannosaminyltransferase